MYFFEKKNPEIFRFVTLPIKIPDKTVSYTPGNSTKFCLTPLAISRPKTKIHGDSSEFFSITPRNSTPFLINPWNFHTLFFKYPWKFHVFSSHVWVFSGIAQLAIPKKLI